MKKILAIFLVGIFLFSSLLSFSSLAKESIDEPLSDNIEVNTEKQSSFGNPDLVSEFEYLGDRKYTYIYVTTITNVGTGVASFPKGSVIMNRHAKYLNGIERDYDRHAKEDIELLPGESTIVDGHGAQIILAWGSLHTITTDPYNIVDEGSEGETNNVEQVRCLKERSLLSKNIFNQFFLKFIEKCQNFLPLLRYILDNKII